MSPLDPNFLFADPPVPSAGVLVEIEKFLKEHLEAGKQERMDRFKIIEQARKMHADDFKFREKQGSIYEYSNIGVPVIKSIVTNYQAKFYHELVGEGKMLVEPVTPLEASPGGMSDDKLREYWRWELEDEVRINKKRADAVDTVALEGTVITKRRWSRLNTFFKRKVRYLHAADGSVVNGPDGQPITERTNLAHREIPVIAGGQQVGARTAFFLPDGREIDGSMQWKEHTVTDSVCHYDNADLDVIPWEDFICDLTVAKTSDSKVRAHVYKRRLHEIHEVIFSQLHQTMEVGAEQAEMAGKLPGGWILEGVQGLENLPEQQATNKDSNSSVAEQTPVQASAQAAKAYLREIPWGGIRRIIEAKGNREATIAECYFKYDVDGDGWMEDLMGLYETNTGKLLYLNYLVNIYTDCKDPFTVHRLFKVPNRWYGMGPYEFLKLAQDFVDANFNRTNYRTAMNANPMPWIDESAFEEVPKKWMPGAKFRLKPNRNGANAFGFYVMPDKEEIERANMEFFISLIRLISGVTNPAAGEVADLPSDSTATGVTAIIQEGNKMFMMLMDGIKTTFEEEAEGLINLIRQNGDKTRVYTYFDGKEDVRVEMDPNNIRHLRYRVKIRLARGAVQQRIQTSQAAIQVVNSFAALPAQYQIRLRRVFIRILEDLGMWEADQMLPSVQELDADQKADEALKQAASVVQDCIQRIKVANLPPNKTVVSDLEGVLEALQAQIAQPPDETEMADSAAPGEQPIQNGPQAPNVSGAPPARVPAPMTQVQVVGPQGAQN